MIFSSFTPNMQRDDIWIAIKALMPWNWRYFHHGLAANRLAKELSDYFAQQVILYDSGRTAFYQILKAYNFPKGSEVIIQALTCSVVPHAILRAGHQPIYADINSSYNLDPAKLPSKITSKTKAIVVQHTFGIPADTQKIKEICQQHGLVLIEDLAISLGAQANNQLVGTIGDSAFFSFGAAKVISCSRGGGVTTTNKKLLAALAHNYQSVKQMPTTDIVRHLAKPIIFAIGKTLYNFASIGKGLLYICRKFHLTPVFLLPKEKTAQGQIPSYQLANPLAEIASNQLKKLSKYQTHRQKITQIYNQKFGQSFPSGTSLMNYPLATTKRQQIFKSARKEGILLDNWYSKPIAPPDSNAAYCQYQSKSCPQAESICQEIITLPNHIGISQADAHKIAKIVHDAS